MNGTKVTGPRPALQTVRADGTSVAQLIDGVRVRPIVTHQDSRGSLGELFSQSWDTSEPPVVHAYFVTVRPGQVKGWAVHQDQLDRYAFISGSLKLVLFDSRDLSPTYGHVSELYFSEINRSLVSVPAGIFHAVENVGLIDGMMFNFPDVPYNHEMPDKCTLPIENEIIPYKFSAARGH